MNDPAAEDETHTHTPTQMPAHAHMAETRVCAPPTLYNRLSACIEADHSGCVRVDVVRSSCMLLH